MLASMLKDTFREVQDCIRTGRPYPAWIEKQLEAIEMILAGDQDRGIAQYISAREDLADHLDSLLNEAANGQS